MTWYSQLLLVSAAFLGCLVFVLLLARLPSQTQSSCKKMSLRFLILPTTVYIYKAKLAVEHSGGLMFANA